MDTKNFDFNVGSNSTLTLKALYAQVNVRKGQANKTIVKMSGDDKLLKLIKVTQKGNDVTVEGQENMGDGNITIINNSGRSSVYIRGSASGVVVGSISCGRIVTGDNILIIGDNVISGKETKITEIESIEMPVITITVPEGTDLDAESVESLDSQGLNGKLYLSIEDQGSAKVLDVTKSKISCSDQSHCRIGNALGDLKISCSDQSDAIVKGNFDDVDVSTSDQSSVRVIGNSRDFESRSSDQSSISLTGHTSGKVRKHESDQSSIHIN